MSANVSAKSGKLKKSKLEKIFELEADLKIAQEENARMHQELEWSRGGSTSSFPSLTDTTVDSSETEQQMRKMKDAFFALRNVTVNQEKSLHKMKSKAAEHKKEVKEKDCTIKMLEEQVKSLEETQKALVQSRSADAALRIQLEDLQLSFFREMEKSAKLQRSLNEKEDVIANLRERLDKSQRFYRRGSERSVAEKDSQSKHSPSASVVARTAGFDIAKKSKQMASRLDSQLEEMTKEVGEFKRVPGFSRTSMLGNSALINTDALDPENGSEAEFSEGQFFEIW